MQFSDILRLDPKMITAPISLLRMILISGLRLNGTDTQIHNDIYTQWGIPPIAPRPFAVSLGGANTLPRTTPPNIPYIN